MPSGSGRASPMPLFIVGAPRSGTSLLRDLVRLFDGVYLPPDEMQILPLYCDGVRRGRSVGSLMRLLEASTFASHMRRRKLWPAGERLRTAVTGRDAARDLAALVHLLAEAEGVGDYTYWGDKTPGNVFCADLLLSVWPEARILYVERDPRDSVLSMGRAWGRSIVRGAVIWRDAVRAGADLGERLSVTQYRRTRHEDLTVDPVTELSQIASWLGVEFDPSALEGFRTEERWGRASGQTGIVRSRLSWKDDDARTIRRIEEIVFSEMQEAGYLPHFADAAVEPSALHLRFAKVADGWNALTSYARERGVWDAVAYKARQWGLMRLS